MTPNEKLRLESLASAAFNLAKRMQVGREFLRDHGITHTAAGIPVPCSLAYHMRRSNKRAARAIRKNADEIINTLYKQNALKLISFESVPQSARKVA